MKTKEKKEEIKTLIENMLNNSHKEMVNKIDQILNSGPIDVDNWDIIHNPMIIPKCIVSALLEEESKEYNGKGTCFEKSMKKEIKNIKYFI